MSSLIYRSSKLQDSNHTKGGSNKNGTMATSQTTTTTLKKKFGKNLNKLVKPAAPPIAPNDKSSNRNSRNGLLLLSTKKSSSNNNHGSSTGSAAATSGLLSSNSKTSHSVAATGTLPSAATASAVIHAGKSSAASTHDVLLSAVVGASQQQSDVTAQPDAWGVAEKNQQRISSISLEQSAPPKEEKAAEPEVAKKKPEETKTQPAEEPKQPSSSSRVSTPVQQENEVQQNCSHDSSTTASSSRPSQPRQPLYEVADWDEYGGRGGRRANADLVDCSDQPSSSVSAPVENQEALMSRLAKKRAEKRRSEEDSRILSQKEAAARRLRELDQKAAKEAQVNAAPKAPVPPAPAWDRTRSGTRTLWEPEQNAEDLSRTVLPPSQTARGSNKTPSEEEKKSTSDSHEPEYSGPVIHLSSYEDRDRGEPRSNAAPRMLFDPKSGSMVAVKSKEETDKGNSNNRRGKDRGKKKGKDSKESPTSAATANSAKSGRKNVKAKKETDTLNSGKDALSVKKPERPRFPRTCGVLYARDEKGNTYCADGCEGDLGYGAHSVPGGRSKNVDAYCKYIEQQDQQEPAIPGSEEEGTLSDTYDHQKQKFSGGLYEDTMNKYSSDGDKNKPMALYTGYNPAEEEQPEPLEWVKASDKIELVTGVDESPTLKPTARAFAPSQAALAAAAAAAAELRAAPNESADNAAVENGSVHQDTEAPTDDDEDDDGPLGLGFDPTQHMADLVMHSPSHSGNQDDEDADPVERLATVGLNSLVLDPPVFSSTTPTTGSGPRHIFAFGSSGTWGTQEMASALTGGDWSVPLSTATGSTAGASTAAGLFGEPFRNADDSKATAISAASFLNITGDSWGVPEIGGFTGGVSPAAAATNEGATTTAAPGD